MINVTWLALLHNPSVTRFAYVPFPNNYIFRLGTIIIDPPPLLLITIHDKQNTRYRHSNTLLGRHVVNVGGGGVIWFVRQLGSILTKIKIHIYTLLSGMPDESLTAMLMESQDFWDLTPCRLVNNYWRFGGPCSLRLQGTVVHEEWTTVPTKWRQQAPRHVSNYLPVDIAKHSKRF